MKSPLLVAAVMLALATSSGAQEVRRVLRIRPGSAVESAALLGTNNTSQLTEGARAASAGGGWTYRIAAPGGSLVRLEVRSEGALIVSPSGDDGKPLPPVSRSGASLAVRVPAAASLGSGVRFHFKATGGQGLLREAVVTVIMADANRNGVPDAVDAFLRGGAPAGAGVAAVPLPTRPFTAFQTGQPYNPAIAPPTDAALVFSADRDVLQGWREAGYVVKTMGGFRQYEPYVKANPHEVQTDRNGSMIVIGGNSYYMIPTTGLNEKQRAYYAEAAANGVYAVCPEEPEIFARAGYSEAFKQEWQALYGAPWEPPHSSMEARVKAERLKMQLCLRQIQAVLGPLASTHPGVRRMLAVHSPVTYPHWGITVPHYALFRLPAVQEVIGQVWTGTARTPTRVAGVRAERTFPLAYVEYSSLVHLLRGTSKPLWALMDPVEDNPDLPMDDYIRNYRETLAASLMFPGLDRFEVMPWPSRIYGRVPADYATVINTVVGALTEMWRYPIRKIEAGSEGVGVLIADSMSYQRGDPHPSDFDGFYGLAMPMVMHGLPLQVLSLDRCSEQGYLSGVRTLLTSYDFMKPDAPECNIGLADWVRKGGSLIMVGGTDPYNGLADSWWRKAGLNSPMEDLFLRLGIEPRRVLEEPGVRNVVSPTELLRGDPEERSLKNRRRYTVDLSPFVRETGSVSVRFEDVSRADGWGPYLASAELRINDVLAASFQAGSELETRFLAEDRNSVCNADARFADGDAYWVYRFDGLPREASVKLTLDIGNGFLVSAYPAPPANRLLEAVASGPGALPAYTPDRMLQRIRVLDGYTLTAYAPPADAQVLYRRAGDGVPIVWHAKVGNGSLIYAGVAPAFFTATSQTDRWIRELTRRAFETNGDTLTFATGFVSRRGPYVAARALAGDISLDGSYVDLLAANLPVVESPQVSAGQAAFLRSAGGSGGSTPSVLAVSGRTTARMETATATAFVVQAPASTVGAARLAAGRRTFVGAKACTLRGEAVAVSARQERGTVLLRYDNNPEGVAVRVSWK
ncbi:MAG: hypothetical protein GX446_00700 [Chthonomonadales bacterium]|nr:hypothetical protein [Chthonomonadales bacterium]